MESADARFHSRKYIHKAVLLGAFLLAILGTIHFVSLPTDSFVANVIVDDAVYYAIPARNVVSHRGYTFDGQIRTNGVQPLWAFVTIGLAYAIPDHVTLLRALSLTSGLCWIAAGSVLYLTISPFGRWTAIFIAAGWLFTGFWNRIAFQGMENGLHGLLFASLLHFGIHTGHPSTPVKIGRVDWYLRCGLLLALLTLKRGDTGLMAVLLWAAGLLGFVRHPEEPGRRFAPARAALLALPGILIVGGCLLLNRIYFGTAMPISGQVKMFYESTWTPQHGDAWDSVIWHACFLFDIMTEPLARNVEQFLWQSWSVAWPRDRSQLILLCIAAIAIISAIIRQAKPGNGRRETSGPRSVFFAMFILFAILHFLFYATQLAHFTGYGTWYFAPEIMVGWLGLGWCFNSAGRLWSRRTPEPAWLMAFLSLAMILCAYRPVWSSPPQDIRTSQFLTSARWMNETLPARTKIGAFSAGIVAYFANNHRVFNLDGLMNTKEYLDRYIRTWHIPDYARDQGIEYLCDYAPLETWQSGAYWGFPTKNMELVRWWRMDGGLGYGVWRLFHDGRTRNILDAPTGWCDRISQIRYAAEVERRFELVSQPELNSYVQSGRLKGKRLVDSLADPATGALWHIIIREDQIQSLGISPNYLDVPIPVGCIFDESLELLGVDVPHRSVARGDALIMTRFWRVLKDSPRLADASIEVRIDAARSARLLHATRGCHDTFPIGRWKPGEIVIETYAVRLPSDLRRGRYPVTIHLTGGGQTPLSSDRPGLLTNIEVR